MGQTLSYVVIDCFVAIKDQTALKQLQIATACKYTLVFQITKKILGN